MEVGGQSAFFRLHEAPVEGTSCMRVVKTELGLKHVKHPYIPQHSAQVERTKLQPPPPLNK